MMSHQEIIDKIHAKIDWKEFNYLMYKLTQLEDSGFQILLFILERVGTTYENFPDQFISTYMNDTKSDKGEFIDIERIIKSSDIIFKPDTKPYYLIVLKDDNNKVIEMLPGITHEIVNLIGDKFTIEKVEKDKLTIASNI